MPALASDLRRQLENVVIQARDVAEAAARSALQKRAVDAAEPFPHFNAAEKEQRNRLRARGRQVGDVRDADKKADHRPTHPGTRLRVLASNAVRPVPGRKQSADAPGRRGRQPGGVRRAGANGGPARPERLRPGGAVRRRHAAADFPHRRRAAGDRVRPGTANRTGKGVVEAAPSDFLGRRQPRLGLPVLADQEEGRGQQERSQDRRPHPARGDAAVHRTLHGAVPPAQHHRGVVVRAAQHQRTIGRGGCAGGKSAGRDGIPPLAGRWHAGGRVVRRLAENPGRIHHARPLLRQRPFPGQRPSTCSCRFGCTTRSCPPRRRARPSCGKTCSAWNSTPAVRRSPPSPWPWLRGSTPARTASRSATANCRR